ncbi:MAG: RNA 2',3'-cyclic phosphodiesterase, partial [Acidimicrobiales bacterium]
PEDRPFRGHLTLARARDRGGVDLRPRCGAAFAASWVVREVTLVASRLGAGAARYDVVDRLALG